MNPLTYNSLLRNAQVALDRNDWLQCEYICQDLLKQNKNDAKVHFFLYRIHNVQAHQELARKHIEKCVELEPKNLQYRLSQGAQLAHTGKYQKAIAALRKARRAMPDAIHLIPALANAYEMAGEYDAARELLSPLVEQKKDDMMMAMIWARLALVAKQPEAAVAVLTRHIPSPSYPSGFMFSLGSACEKTGDIERSFEAYSAANATPKFAFNLDQFLQSYQHLGEVYSPVLLKRLPRPTHDTSVPIFIAGRPRSGTTLIEKILDAHPDVAGVGERAFLPQISNEMNLEIGSSLTYPDCVRDLDQADVNTLSQRYLDLIRQLAPNAKRIVNKHLGNGEYLGLISILFPQASILNVRRKAVDNCWACFVADLNQGWTVNLRTLGITHRAHERLIEHWRETLSLRILDVDYESVVEDQEGWTRKILDFCGLPFDERCLRFYESTGGPTTNQIAAPTLSYNQVRQPIYKTSVNRAAKFDKFLGPLRDGLAEGLEIAEKIIPLKSSSPASTQGAVTGS